MAENRLKSGWQTVAEKVLCKAITTGNILPFGLVVIAGIIAWRLPAADLKEIILTVVNSAWFCVGGWALFAISLYGCKKLIAWRESTHLNEVMRMAEVKNQAVQAHFALPLPTTTPKNP